MGVMLSYRERDRQKRTCMERTVKPHDICRALACSAFVLSLLLTTSGVYAQRTSTTHTISLTAVEFKGSTTTEQLAPPSPNPASLSKGYGYKGPGEADRNAPQRWEVSSYVFTPGFITVQQGDTVILNVFVVNGDHHEVFVTAPDGQPAVPTTTWQRGRHYQLSFGAEKAGAYQLTCTTHAPTMTAAILVLPR
jgi:plastocyanin